MPFATYKRVNGTAPWLRIGAPDRLLPCLGVIFGFIGFRVLGFDSGVEGNPVGKSLEVASHNEGPVMDRLAGYQLAQGSWGVGSREAPATQKQKDSRCQRP